MSRDAHGDAWPRRQTIVRWPEMMLRRVAAIVVAVIGGGMTIYAALLAFMIAVDPITTLPQKIGVFVLAIGLGVAVAIGVRALWPSSGGPEAG